MFECHITLKLPFEHVALSYVEMMAQKYGWKTSQIAGDPILGKESFYYLTSYHEDFETMKAKMHEMADRLGRDVVRKKIEQIVYDTKTSLI